MWSLRITIHLMMFDIIREEIFFLGSHSPSQQKKVISEFRKVSFEVFHIIKYQIEDDTIQDRKSKEESQQPDYCILFNVLYNVYVHIGFIFNDPSRICTLVSSYNSIVTFCHSHLPDLQTVLGQREKWNFYSMFDDNKKKTIVDTIEMHFSNSLYQLTIETWIFP